MEENEVYAPELASLAILSFNLSLVLDRFASQFLVQEKELLRSQISEAVNDTIRATKNRLALEKEKIENKEA